MSGWLVTGTDTGVGKTLTSAAICTCLVAAGHEPTYVKPVQSGSADGDDDAADVRALAGVPTVTGVTLGPALAPAVAARLAGEQLTGTDLLAAVTPDLHRPLVVEGAGGLLVELGTDGTTIVELAHALELPVVVVARPGLGTLNHTALTLEAAANHRLAVAGVIICGATDAPDLAEQTNVAELQRLSEGRLLGIIPHLDDVTPEALSAAPAWLGPLFGGSWSLA
ncbi:MAG: dethiobiotin synthase [Nitriliruptorales bacterium]|nr:dethiobiotin synthase [Nitriliruptorales bacterium]